MKDQLYLISGATGVTGNYAARTLLGSQAKVRAFVHRHDQRSEALAELGAEIVLGDFYDYRAVRSAMEGVTSSYFCYPVTAGIVQASAYWARAAKDAGTHLIVNMSQVIVREEAKSNASLQHWISERLFDSSGVASVHLRPTFFMEWLMYLAPMVASGTIYGSYDKGKAALVAGEDLGRVVAAILQNPADHAGKTYNLYGPEEHTFEELAQVASRTLGFEVDYKRVEFNEMYERAFSAFTAAEPKDDNGETFLAQHLREAVQDHHNGLFSGTNDLIERVTGVPPISVETFLLRHKPMYEAMRGGSGA